MYIPNLPVLLFSIVFLCPCIWPEVAAAQKRSLSVKDVMALVQSGQPQLQGYRERSVAAGYNIGLAKNTLIPDLTAGYQAGYATDNNITGMSYPGLIMPISG